MVSGNFSFLIGGDDAPLQAVDQRAERDLRRLADQQTHVASSSNASNVASLTPAHIFATAGYRNSRLRSVRILRSYFVEQTKWGVQEENHVCLY